MVSRSAREVAVAVVVLGYRAMGAIRGGSIEGIQRAAARLGAPVIYLDNYSRDGSVQWILEHCPDVDVLLAPENTMYCHGVNVLVQFAARRYRPAYYLLADADNLAEPDCYERLFEFLEAHPSHGLAQPLVRSASDHRSIYSAGHQFTADHWVMPRKEIPEAEVLVDLPSCSISSTMVRSEVFERCGLLDPIFEIYYESADLSARARSSGFRCACVTAAVAYNDGTEAAGIDSMHHRYYFNRNRIIYWRLHDEAIFATVAEEARVRLAELDGRLEASPFGLDATGESVRRGLAAGLAVAGRPGLTERRPVALDGFDKTNAVVLRTAGA